MAVRRRRPAPKTAAAPSTRVHAVHSLEQWRSMLAKAESSGRLVVVQFFQAQNYVCIQMRGYFKRMSVDPAFKAAVFAEVEVDAVEDVAAECGLRAGSAKIPCYQCYVAGELVESYAGGVPSEVASMMQRQLAELRGSGSGLVGKLLVAAGVLVAGAAAAAAYLRFGRGGGGGSGGGSGNLGEELRSVAERIGIAQQRLRNAERAGKLKAAKNQRRILSQLEGQQRALEQRLAQRQAPGSTAGSGGGGPRKRAARRAAAAEGGDEEAAERRRRQQAARKRRAAAAAAAAAEDSSDEDQDGVGVGVSRRVPTAATVLYSDEEEE